MYGMYFSFVLFCIAIYCNLLWWRDYYYHFFTYIHVLFSINVFKRKKNTLQIALFNIILQDLACPEIHPAGTTLQLSFILHKGQKLLSFLRQTLNKTSPKLTKLHHSQK